MKLDEIFIGFNAEKQKLYENFLIDSGVDQSLMEESKNKTKNWTKEQWLEYKHDGDKIHADLVEAINQKLPPSSVEVQKIIKMHYQLVSKIWTPTRESYIGLSQLYGSQPDFVKFYDDMHPKLLKFLIEAMKIFSEKELS